MPEADERTPEQKITDKYTGVHVTFDTGRAFNDDDCVFVMRTMHEGRVIDEMLLTVGELRNLKKLLHRFSPFGGKTRQGDYEGVGEKGKQGDA